MNMYVFRFLRRSLCVSYFLLLLLFFLFVSSSSVFFIQFDGTTTEYVYIQIYIRQHTCIANYVLSPRERTCAIEERPTLA